MPSYRKRIAKGREYAIVKIKGKVHYLGKYGSPESRQKYDRLIAGFVADQEDKARARKYTIADAATDYMAHAKTYYRKNGNPTSEIYVVRRSMQILTDHFDGIRASHFTPLRLQEVRQTLFDEGKAVKTSGSNHPEPAPSSGRVEEMKRYRQNPRRSIGWHTACRTLLWVSPNPTCHPQTRRAKPDSLETQAATHSGEHVIRLVIQAPTEAKVDNDILVKQVVNSAVQEI